MKHTFLFFLVFLSVSEFALPATPRYSCETSNDDGDAYGALLTIRPTLEKLRLYNEWLEDLQEGKANKVATGDKKVVYPDFDFGQDEGSNIEIPIGAVVRGVSPMTMTIDKYFEYRCKRAEQTIEWKNDTVDAGKEVITPDDVKDADEYKLGYASDLKKKKACFRGIAALVISTIMADGIDHHGDESCKGPVVRGKGTRIVFPRCVTEEGNAYSVTLRRCPEAKL